MNFSSDAALLAPHWGKFHMIDEWLWKHLDFSATETLESMKGSPHLLKKSMDTKFYVHTSVMQYYDTNIFFSVGRTCPSDRTLTHCIHSDSVSLKMYSYLTIFQWVTLLGFSKFGKCFTQFLAYLTCRFIYFQLKPNKVTIVEPKTFFLTFLLRNDWSE